MTFLIDTSTQTQISTLIDKAVKQVLSEFVNHGNEEALTSVLGHALMSEEINEPDLRVKFKYRQHNKQTEEKHSGADGSFLVQVDTPNGIIKKASLFQAKLLRGDVSEIRTLTMTKNDVSRLKKQSEAMRKHTDDAVAIFYTHKNIYVVDTTDYVSNNKVSRTPLSQNHRLITLGTYLGKWMPRCTKGDNSSELVTRAAHVDGFKNGLSLDIITTRPSVIAEPDNEEVAWRRKR